MFGMLGNRNGFWNAQVDIAVENFFPFFSFPANHFFSCLSGLKQTLSASWGSPIRSSRKGGLHDAVVVEIGNQELIMKTWEEPLRRVFATACAVEGLSSSRAGFAASWELLRAQTVLRVSKRQARDAFGAIAAGKTPSGLQWPRWKLAIENLAFVDVELMSEKEPLQRLSKDLERAQAIGEDPCEFVHVLRCLGVLNISFSYWDAFRLHRAQTTERTMRTLVEALRDSGALDATYMASSLENFALRMLRVDQTRLPRFDLQLLQRLDELSTVLIDLYPEMGLGCTFNEFVDELVSDNLLESLEPPRSPVENVNGCLERDIESVLSQRKSLVGFLSTSFESKPGFNAWLESIGSVALQNETVEELWIESKDDFGLFLQRLARAEHPSMNTPDAQLLDDFLSRISKALMDKTFPENAPGETLSKFALLGTTKVGNWTRDEWVGCMRTRTIPKLRFRDLWGLFSPHETSINREAFCEKVEIACSKFNVAVRTDPEEDAFKSFPLSLLEKILNVGAEAQTFSSAQLESFCTEAEMVIQRQGKLRVEVLFDKFKESPSKSSWFSTTCTFLQPIINKDGNRALTLSSMAYVYAEMKPISTTYEFVEALLLLLATVEDISADEKRSIFLHLPQGQKEAFFEQFVFIESAKVNEIVLEQVERSLRNVNLSSSLQNMDNDVWALYVSSLPEDEAFLEMNSQSLHFPLVTNAIVLVASTRVEAAEALALSLVAEQTPLEGSSSAVFDFLFSPEVVRAFERSKNKFAKAFARFADEQTKVISQKGFIRLANTINLNIGFHEGNAAKASLVSILRNKKMIMSAYEASLPANSQGLALDQLREALGRLLFSLHDSQKGAMTRGDACKLFFAYFCIV